MLERVGTLQGNPVELVKKEQGKGDKRTLYIDYHKPSPVSILNKDEFGKNIIHEIKIEGEHGLVGRALTALANSLKKMEAMETKIKSLQNRIDLEDLPRQRLPEYDFDIKRSRWHDSKMVFVIKGTAMEDTATESPFNIDMIEGDFITLSMENIPILIKKLEEVSEILS